MLGKPEMHKWNCAFQCRAGCWKALRYIATKVWLKTHNSKLKVTTDGKFCWRDSDQTHFSWFTFPVIFDQTTHRYFDLCLLLVRCDQDFKILCLCPLTFVLFFFCLNNTATSAEKGEAFQHFKLEQEYWETLLWCSLKTLTYAPRLISCFHL